MISVRPSHTTTETAKIAVMVHTIKLQLIFTIIAKIFQQFYIWIFTTIFLVKAVSVVVCKGLYHVLKM